MAAYIEMRNITKRYANGVVANDNAALSINKGEIHAIAGENGAGKSTIMKVLYGAETATGEIYVDGKKVSITSPRIANSLGIGMVYQHFMLINEFPAYQNIFFGIELTNKLGILKKKEMIRLTTELSQKYNMRVDPLELCGQMSVSTAQKVEILKVLARGAKIIILDEPTAVLTPQETEQLFVQLRLLKENGFTIIVITHKLKEIKMLCDRVTVMRQGKTVGVYNVSEVSEADISNFMVGRVTAPPNKQPCAPTEQILTVSNLTVRANNGKETVSDVSFSLRKGEILCFAGVEGNGQREVIRAITGLDKNYTGQLLFDDVDVKKCNIRTLRAKGMSHIPEDRLKEGCDADANIFENLISLDFNSQAKLGFLPIKKLKQRSAEQITKYSVKGDLKQKLSMLSGGNMQKVIIAREFSCNPSLIIADQPTRGVDVGAIESIHTELLKMRDEGKAILLVSADLQEVFNLSDRILVFHNGKITAEIKDVDSVDEMQLGKYMLGIEHMEVEVNEG